MILNKLSNCDLHIDWHPGRLLAKMYFKEHLPWFPCTCMIQICPLDEWRKMTRAKICTSLVHNTNCVYMYCILTFQSYILLRIAAQWLVWSFKIGWVLLPTRVQTPFSSIILTFCLQLPTLDNRPYPLPPPSTPKENYPPKKKKKKKICF